MKHVVNWTIGSFFRTIGRIIAYVIVGALVAFALSYKPKAATLTSYDTYQRYWNQESGCGSSNKYSYTTYANNNPGNDLWEQATIGTRVYNKAAIIGFNFQYNLTAGKYYDVVVNFATSDLSNALNTTNVFVESGSSCQDFNKSYVSLVGFSLSNSGTNYSNKATLRITANTATTYWGFYFYKGVGQYVAGPNNFSVSSITIDEVQASDTDIIINNNTNNTNNIINNQNENTQQIIDSQNELLGSKCENLFNKNNYGYDSDGKLYFDLSNLQTGSTYTLSTNHDVYIYKFSLYNSSSAGSDVGPETWTNGITSWTFTYNGKNRLFLNVNGLNANFATSINDVSSYNFMLVEGSSAKSYCEFGSFTSKLDDATNAINDVNDSLNNDNVDGATGKASNFFSNFTTNTHGLTSIITAPLSAIQSLTSATCSPLVLPIPFVNQNLTLPCMRSIYVDNFGGFMTLYDTITLGIVSYWVMVRIFALVKDFKNPEHDEVEVMDL